VRQLWELDVGGSNPSTPTIIKSRTYVPCDFSPERGAGTNAGPSLTGCRKSGRRISDRRGWCRASIAVTGERVSPTLFGSLVGLVQAVVVVGLCVAVYYGFRGSLEAREAEARRTPEEKAVREKEAAATERRVNRFVAKGIGLLVLLGLARCGYESGQDLLLTREVRMRQEHEAQVRADARIFADEFFKQLDARGRAVIPIGTSNAAFRSGDPD
jgi:hypothetical protein